MKILSLARFPLHRSSSLRRDRRGFTLIELMITVAIVAILTAIAYPAYRNYVIRGQIVNATNGLTTMAANMERFFQDNRTYVTTNGFTSPCTPPGVTYGSFQISCPNALTNPPPAPSPIFTGSTLTATAFQLEAVGVSNSSGNSTGFYYFIDQQGNQGSTVTAPAPSAWIASCAATWETKAGQC